jgi:EAL domain-containing protein (putative c-di-GMP-specific phosphodiesterase class I)/ActR/RegA family two-component response regulator
VNSLLVLDDDPDMCALVARAAASVGYAAASATEFEAFKARLSPDTSVVVLDLMMPGVDGIQVLRYLNDQKCLSEVILISGYDKKVLHVANELAKALGLNVRASIQKPIKLEALRDILAKPIDGKHESAAGEAGDEGFPDETSVRQALTEDQLLVHYQPKVHLRTGTLAGVEALVRWQHPRLSLVPAGTFIEAFEALGLIDELTWIVVRKVLADKRKWSSEAAPIPVSVNLSALSLRDLSLPERLLAVIEQQGGEASGFVLEITESGLVKELHTALDILARMRLKGFGLSIDDFGTGYATMQQLQRVPARELKLDLTFVQSMLIDESADAIVRKTIELAHDLDMTVVAEGVETTDQLRRLQDYGCDVAQGFLLGRPGPFLGRIPPDLQLGASSRKGTDSRIVAGLERLTGRKIRSREDIREYVNALALRANEKRSKSQRLKTALLATLLLAAFAQYYFIDVQLQIMSQPTLTVFVPTNRDPAKPYLGG